MEKDPRSQARFARWLLHLCEAKIEHDPESLAAQDAAERIDAAFMALLRGFDWNTFEWAAVVSQLEELSKAEGEDASVAAAAMIDGDPRLADHRDLLVEALAAWRADSGKWKATLRLLDAAGIYKNPPRRRDLAAEPSELLRQRWAQIRRKGVPLAFRPAGWGE